MSINFSAVVNQAMALSECEKEVERLRERLAEANAAFEAEQTEKWEMAARLAAAEALIQTLIDNNPDDDAADAVTVYQVWLKDARRFMEKQP